MTEYRVGNGIVRMHGTPDREKVKAAAEQFLKAIEKQKKQQAFEQASRQDAEECEKGMIETC